MEKITLQQHSLHTLFEEVDSNDPVLQIGDSVIILSPFYFNYSFLSCFFPLGASIYILTQQNDFFINIGCILLILFSLYLILNQLKFHNTIIIDIHNKFIRIVPGVILNNFIKQKQISFNSIKSVIIVEDGFWMADKRYIVSVNLKNDEELKLISSGKENNASHIVTAISKLIKQTK